MKNHLPNRSNRLGIDLNLAIYGSLVLVLMGLLMMTVVPLLRQPIPLYELAKTKPNTRTIAPIIIGIQKNGKYRLNIAEKPNNTLSLESLKVILKKHFTIMDIKKTAICIKANSTILFGEVMQLIEWLEAIGAKHIGLIIDQSFS